MKLGQRLPFPEGQGRCELRVIAAAALGCYGHHSKVAWVGYGRSSALSILDRLRTPNARSSNVSVFEEFGPSVSGHRLDTKSRSYARMGRGCSYIPDVNEHR